MKTYKYIIYILTLSIGLSFTHSSQAMTFEEYEQLLLRENIVLGVGQKQTLKKFFTSNIETIQSGSGKKPQNKINGFDNFSIILKKDLTDKLIKNSEISELQKLLKKSGYTITHVDGYYGPETIRAVESLKTDMGIHNTAYGIFNPRDFQRTNELQKLQIFLGSDEIFFYDLNKKYIDSNTKITCNNKDVPTMETEHAVIFPLTFPYGDETPFSCFLETGKTTQKFLSVHKKENKKVTSHAHITVSKTYSTPNKANDMRVQKERSMLKKMYQEAASKETALFEKPFMLPLDTKMNSPFGKTRIINGKVSSFHTGTDFKAVNPLPIRSVNDGIVMYTGDLFYCGQTVIINHGMDIFSIYCHLSDINVEQNQNINQGDIIGKTGATGRVSGPHLHLSMKFEGKYMDFMRVYEYSKILAEK